MEKKSIVIFTNTLIAGGAEKQALLLAISLKDLHDVLIVVYYGQMVEEKFRLSIAEHKLKVICLSGSHLKKMLSFWSLLRKNKVSIIFSYLLTTNLIGSVVGKIARVPVRVGGIRNAQLDKKKLPFQRFINNYLSTHTIFNNYDGIEKLQAKGFRTKHAVVIPNCFDLTTLPRERELQEVVKIITVGRYVHQKGYFGALKIMKELKAQGIKFHYHIIGFGELETLLRDEIVRLKLGDVVEMVNNPDNLPEYYIKSDIYLCTSFFEGLSNTVMEALSYSMPVVASDVGDNNRLVYDGVNGYLISDWTPEKMIGPLKTLIANPELRNKFGKESFRIIRDNYSSNAFKNNYAKFISDLTIN
ncbi:glycosyltransferase [Mucilaginibacter sp. McL0603]|uniref:glycosyltransferase n=1 Tax=Mucilaginibacter sp. McL0603 TaxID=3415670 RepID=UPI003CF26779